MLVPLPHLMAGATDMMVAHLFILWSNMQIHFHMYPLTRIPRYLVWPANCICCPKTYSDSVCFSPGQSRSTRRVDSFLLGSLRALGRFEHLPGCLDEHPDGLNIYPDTLKSTHIVHILFGFNSYKHWLYFAIDFFSSSNKFKGYKIIDLTRPIEFSPSNHSTSNKEPSGIRPLGRLICNKGPSCYKA
jgi:hypothetical protein